MFGTSQVIPFEEIGRSTLVQVSGKFTRIVTASRAERSVRNVRCRKRDIGHIRQLCTGQEKGLGGREKNIMTKGNKRESLYRSSGLLKKRSMQ